MRITRRHLIRGVAGLAGLALVGSGLAAYEASRPPTLSATADFADVSNLVAGAPVELAGVAVGSVKSIALDGSEAKVVLTIERSADVPAGVSADVEQSTVLGQEVVELEAPSSPGGTDLLSNGSTISRTALIPGIQQFVGGGTAVLGSIGTSQLASLINAGGQGFGGQAAELKALISNLNTVLAGYSSRSGEIKSLVAGMNKLSSSLAPDASSNAQALSNLARTVTILNQQSNRFENLLSGLDSLAVQGRSLLGADMQQINLQFTGLSGVTSELSEHQAALAELLQELPGHDLVMHDVTVNRFVQIVDDLIVCGLPDGGGNTTQPASSCHGADGSG